MSERFTAKGVEEMARQLAAWHGSAIVRDGKTIAAEHGYGSWGHSPERYAERHWQEYHGAAIFVLERELEREQEAA